MATSANPGASATFIDGGVLEGGGQLVRNAIAFSALLSRPISITNIRQNRKPQGLKPQHVAGLP
jgi:RNA 3'-terminal phosphate cyclase (ATP)